MKGRVRDRGACSYKQADPPGKTRFKSFKTFNRFAPFKSFQYCGLFQTFQWFQSFKTSPAAGG
jgi:hypothetical protein